jgi:ribonuclease P protein component
LNKELSFPRSHRLTTKADFQAVFDYSKKINQKHLLVLYKPNQLSIARLGVMVGKRVASDAVVRNRIKRTIRESFRHNQDRLKGYDLVVIARQQCDTLINTKLREGIDGLWEKLLAQLR